MKINKVFQKRKTIIFTRNDIIICLFKQNVKHRFVQNAIIIGNSAELTRNNCAFRAECLLNSEYKFAKVMTVKKG